MRQCFERHKETWEPTARKTEAIAEKAWHISQSSNTKREAFQQDWDGLLSLERGWEKDIDDMVKVWKGREFCV